MLTEVLPLIAMFAFGGLVIMIARKKNEKKSDLPTDVLAETFFSEEDPE